MKIDTTRSDSHATLVLRGEFGTDEVPAFLEQVEDLLAAGTALCLIVFRYVKYVNSTALGAVMRAMASCKEAGGRLAIARPSAATRDVIAQMGLDSVLPLFDDEEQGVGFLYGDDGERLELSVPDEGRAQKPVAMFSFPDERSELFRGKSHHGVAYVDHVDADGIAVRWDPAQHDSDLDTAAKMFPIGGSMQIKMQLKLIRKEFFQLASTIADFRTEEAGTVLVSARWAELKSMDREALERHAADVRFLREQVEGSS